MSNTRRDSTKDQEPSPEAKSTPYQQTPKEVLPQSEVAGFLKSVREMDLRDIERIANAYDITKYKNDGDNILMYFLRHISQSLSSKEEDLKQYKDFCELSDAKKENILTIINTVSDKSVCDISLLSPEKVKSMVNDYFHANSQPASVQKLVLQMTEGVWLDYQNRLKTAQDMIDIFLRSGISIDSCADQNKNPLMLVMSQDLNLAHFLIKRGARVFSRNISEPSPISELIEYSHLPPYYFQKALHLFFTAGNLTAAMEREDLQNFISQLDRKITSKIEGRQKNNLMFLREELLAKKYSKTGSNTLFWQCAKAIAAKINETEDPQAKEEEIVKKMEELASAKIPPETIEAVKDAINTLKK